MPASSEEGVVRRKRVVQACDTCRAMKSKCDGRHPTCTKCTGYGYKCGYSLSGRRKLIRKTQQPRDSPGNPSQCTLADALRGVVTDYDRVIRDVILKLPGPDRPALLDTLASLRSRSENALARLGSCDIIHSRASDSPGGQSQMPNNCQRYLGEASDVRFFNLVARVLQKPNLLAAQADERMDSYEQDDSMCTTLAPAASRVDMPSLETADMYIDIYFSTIHIAYPVISERAFLKPYRALRESGSIDGVSNSWLAALYTIFAIGAYYSSFPRKETGDVHEQYFKYALALSNLRHLERSVEQVSFLLIECFYLLAVCRTDRCWTTLGLAIRVAQSIGMHIDLDDFEMVGGPALLKAEMRRRVWYSLYVLDRLLSLQLGRPPAVHDDDCHVALPSRVDVADLECDSENANLVVPEGPSTGDYLLSVISLSRIIGHVLRDLYNPQRIIRVTEELSSTMSLDKELLDWKRSLPRTLRFDFGHAFETSVTFRRQRNMLAVKFHHLRAVIHRPYLCLPFLKHLDDAAVTSLQVESCLIDKFEKTCIAEAQETAHLLHNINDEKDLVHDFPFWQMISCLIFASSVLLVASVFIPRGGSVDEDLDVTALNDDAETCLKVFEALSTRSDAARIARDMMTRLKEQGQKWTDDPSQSVNMRQSQFQMLGDIEGQVHRNAAFEALMEAGPETALMSAQDWPSEIVDSMAWSAQFFNHGT